MDFDLMISNLKNNIPFKYARYGDGEWNCILGKQGVNCDGHFYYPDLSYRLKSILESKPDYYLGLQSMAINQNIDNPEFKRLVSENNWCDNEILHRASINNYLSLFFDAIDDRNIIVVGGPYLHKLFHEETLFSTFVTIKNNNCWQDYKIIKGIIETKIEFVGSPVILLCASMMSEVLIDDFRHTNHTFIDCGSVFDPYCGISSRTYHKEIIQRYAK